MKEKKMKKIISVNDWEIDSLNVVAEYNDDKLRIINNNATSISFRCKKNLHFKEVIDGKLLVKFNGECCNSGGYLILNNNIKLPINSESSIYVKFPSIISLDLVVAAESEITISNIDFEFYESCDLVDKLDVKNDVLVIVPDYPSYVNLYSCAFAHSRNSMPFSVGSTPLEIRLKIGAPSSFSTSFIALLRLG